MRRKGERPIVTPPEPWTETHPIARAMREGDSWLYAWLRQRTTPMHVIERIAKIDRARLDDLWRGAEPTPEEIERLAVLWKQPPEALAASIAYERALRAIG